MIIFLHMQKYGILILEYVGYFDSNIIDFYTLVKKLKIMQFSAQYFLGLFEILIKILISTTMG